MGNSRNDGKGKKEVRFVLGNHEEEGEVVVSPGKKEGRDDRII